MSDEGNAGSAEPNAGSYRSSSPSQRWRDPHPTGPGPAPDGPDDQVTTPLDASRAAPGGAVGGAVVTPTMVPADPIDATALQKLLAEGLGTFVLVFFGCGTVLASFAFLGPGAGFGAPDYVGIALAFGVAVLAMAYAVGHLSGGHFNPAVSLGHALAGRMDWRDCGLYTAAQFGGAFAASLALFVIAQLYDYDDAMAGVSPKWNTEPGAAWFGALLLELIGTAVFVFVVLAVTDRRRVDEAIPAPVVIGLALALSHLALIGLTGAGLNPARALMPALFGGWDDALKFQWLYLIAGFGGGAAAGALYPIVFGRDREHASRPPRAPKPPKPPKAPKASPEQQPPQQAPGPWGPPQPGQQPGQQPGPYAQPGYQGRPGGYQEQTGPYGQPPQYQPEQYQPDQYRPDQYRQPAPGPWSEPPQQGEWPQQPPPPASAAQAPAGQSPQERPADEPQWGAPAEPWVEPDDSERTQIRPPHEG